jgi:hypothetical protein
LNFDTYISSKESQLCIETTKTQCVTGTMIVFLRMIVRKHARSVNEVEVLEVKRELHIIQMDHQYGMVAAQREIRITTTLVKSVDLFT